MLKTFQAVKTPSVECLLNLWAQRYVPDLSSLSLHSVQEAASPTSRALTTAKLKDNVLDLNCQMAWIQTKNLYSYIGNILNLSEARLITQFAFRVYKKLLEFYQHHSLSDDALLNAGVEGNSVSEWGSLVINELAYALEPILMVFQEQHLASKDWRSLGFMTTQLNFTNKLIFKKLTSFEKILLTPYLKFIEEQVAMPWHRVCFAGAKYDLGSPNFTLVEQMLPTADEISLAVYCQLVQLLPNYRSRRGGLNEPDVTHSCIRDLNMFQAYLWLCFLQDSMEPIEKELLPLCVMVVEGVGIKWEMTEKWCQLLADEVISRVNPEQKALLLPYIHQMQQLFFEQRGRLGFIRDVSF
ncbi:MAG: hypothetical protein DSM106950_10725 [Stigonema ocellatum SAG 48.90 = DSM 106950]|nr:hypothetical protein [Stigonema ocellatum SAG 48.90 = DSM 106950]